MINLLYVVLIAMLAINISSDVLEGYGQMNNDYLPQIKSWKNITGLYWKELTAEMIKRLYLHRT